MIPSLVKEIITLDDGREIIIETGRLAKQADGSVVIKMGDTMLLATVVISKEVGEGVDFLPLTVDYREKFYAGGRIPGNFFRRETKPSDEEILTMRLVDRVLRPMFPSNFYFEVQVMISLISYDKRYMPESLAGLAASSALSLTNIPFTLVSEVRVVRIDGIFKINPSIEEVIKSDIDIIVGGSKDSIVMVEGSLKEVCEEDLLDAIIFGHKEIIKQIDAQHRLSEKLSFKCYPKKEYKNIELYSDINDWLINNYYSECYNLCKTNTSKLDRNENFSRLLENIINDYTIYNKEYDENKINILKKYFLKLKKDCIRNLIIKEGLRLDGRKNNEIRDIWCDIDYLPSTHGSAIFTRGETQALAAVTLGSSKDANMIDGLVSNYDQKFFLHYNFPPFSTGELRPIRGTSRREVGHGNLAQRALSYIIPSDCPYTIRLVSEILESNGSSSMATVCAGTLALMDSGINIIRPVSGIAMGLIKDDNTNNYIILSDILGDEDHVGDMDFKIAGTEIGITACQMDIKINGIDIDILRKALYQAKEGRLKILKRILQYMPCPRASLKDNAPKLICIEIPKIYIGQVIGPGGKVIQEIQKNTDTVISISELDDKGIVEVSGFSLKNINIAIDKIKDIAFVPEIGRVYNAKVKSIKPFGAFVEIHKGIEALLHISEIDITIVKRVEDVLTVGQSIDVKFLGYDKNMKIKISRKKILLDKTNNL